LEAVSKPWFIAIAQLRTYAHCIANQLIANTMCCCAGDDWRPKLIEAAASCQVFAAVLSSEYFTRFWCMRELHVALHGLQGHPRDPDKLRIIPVLVDSSVQLHLQQFDVKAY
jgi:hypothetical protein